MYINCSGNTLNSSVRIKKKKKKSWEFLRWVSITGLTSRTMFLKCCFGCSEMSSCVRRQMLLFGNTVLGGNYSKQVICYIRKCLYTVASLSYF